MAAIEPTLFSWQDVEAYSDLVRLPSCASVNSAKDSNQTA